MDQEEHGREVTPPVATDRGGVGREVTPPVAMDRGGDDANVI